MAVKITGDKKLRKKLTKLSKSAKNATAIHKVMGLKAMSDVDQQFRKEGKQFGKAWKPLLPATIKRRRKGSSRILRDTGRMAQSLNFKADRQSAVVGFGDKKAEFHQFGSKPKRRVGSSSGKKRTSAGGGLPARPMLPMGTELDRYIKKTIIPLVERTIAQVIR